MNKPPGTWSWWLSDNNSMKTVRFILHYSQAKFVSMNVMYAKVYYVVAGYLTKKKYPVLKTTV